jgi:hypothetical protein
MADLLGEIVTWDITKADTSFANVQSSLTDAGLDPAAAAELTPRTAFNRACKDLKKERAIDKLRKEGDLLKFQFTKKHLEEGKIQYDYECFVTLNPDTGDISCPENPALETAARQMFAIAMQQRNSQDITRLVQKLFTEHADLYAINPRKGVAYFVPECHRGFTAKVDTFLGKLGGCLLRFPVPSGTTEGNASVREAVQQGLGALLDELNQTVASWDEGTRKSTQDRALARWEAIKYKVEAYAEYLGDEQSRMLEAVAVARKALAEKVMSLETPTETAA